MDASSVVSSIAASLEFHKPPPPPPTTVTMVHTAKTKKWAESGVGGGAGGRRQGYDICQRSEVSTGTDLSNERPSTRDTNTLFMRDASILSGQPDKSNFREKMQSWTTAYDEEGGGTGFVAPRPTTSFASQKPTSRGAIMEDIEREMSFLMSRPSTSFPTKPKELIEPLDGLLPEERPVSQKKFLVLPSIGNNHHNHHHHNQLHHHHHGGDLYQNMRRQRSNIETTNQLDYSRGRLEHEANFFTDYYNYQNYPTASSYSHDHYRRENSASSPPRNPRESPTKGGCAAAGGGKTATPMPLPPIVHKLKWEKRLMPAANLAGLEEEFSRDHSQLSSSSSALDEDDDDDEEEEDPDFFRVKTPDSLNSCSPNRTFSNCPIPPPPDFR